MAVDIGKVFEDQIEDVFRLLQDSHLLGWHRFPDTHSAGGNIIQPQPSDYLLALPYGAALEQRAVFFEAKASDKHKNMQKSLVSAEQRGFIGRYHQILRLPYIVGFYSAMSGALELWDGDAFLEGRLNKAHQLGVLDAAGAKRRLDKKRVAQFLVEFFDLPDKRETVKLYSLKYG